MAKKQQKRDLDDMQPDGGDLPYLLTLKADKKHIIDVELSTLEKCKDGGPKDKWSCYRVTIDGNEESEVPFYMMQEFIDCVGDEWKSGTDQIEVTYKRTVKNDENIATFQIED